MIRLALCGLATMLDDIVTLLVADLSDVEIVARLEATGDLRQDFDRSGADLLVCALDEGEMEAAWQAELANRPPLAILNLYDDSRRGRIYALRRDERVMEPVSKAGLASAIREFVR